EEAKHATGKGSVPNITEASEQLERFKLAYTDTTANLMQTERQFRHILGLPAADSREIVPTTAPTEDKVELDYEECRATMLTAQPDLTAARGQAATARATLLSACKALIQAAGSEKAADPRCCLVSIEAAFERLTRQEASVRQVERQTTHTLRRFTC